MTSIYFDIVFFFRGLQGVFGRKLSVLRVTNITTTQKLGVSIGSNIILLISISYFYWVIYMLRLPHLTESSWVKPAGFTSGSQEEAPQPEPPGVEESSSGAPASQEPGVPEQALQQPKYPKINFRVRGQ